MSLDQQQKISVIYRRPEDWEALETQLKIRAETNEIWEYIHDGSQWPQKPKAPLINTFPARQRTAASTIRQTRQHARHIQETAPGSSSTGTQDSVTVGRSQRPSDTPETPEPELGLATAITKPTKPSQLTEDGRIDWNQAQREYEHQVKEYNAHLLRKGSVKTWFLSAVSETYQRTCFQNGDLDIWYWRLRETAEAEIANAAQRASANYDDICGSGLDQKYVNQKFLTWIQQWEDAMALGERYEVPQVQHATYWTNHLFKGVAMTFPNWATSYRISKQDAINDNSISYRVVAADLRREWQQSRTTSGRVQRGVHAAHGAIHDKSNDGNEEDWADDRRHPQSQERRRNRHGQNKNRGRGAGRGQQKHAREGDQDEDREKRRQKVECECCAGPHTLEECWMAFPEQAPEWYQPWGATMRLAKLRLRDDDGLIAKVDDIKAKQSNRQRRQ